MSWRIGACQMSTRCYLSQRARSVTRSCAAVTVMHGTPKQTTTQPNCDGHYANAATEGGASALLDKP